MQLWLLAAFLAAFVLANQSDNEIERSVFRTWNNGPVRFVDDELLRVKKEEKSQTRSKRSVMSNAATLQIKLGFGSCQTPGYTGEGCVHPICPIMNEIVPDNPATDGLGATIDKTWLANCSQEYLVYVDDTMSSIRFELETEQALNPYLSLQSEDGSVYIATQNTRTPTTYEGFFFTLPPGKYKVTPTADLLNQACVLTIRAKTNLNVAGGFVSFGYDQAKSDFPGGFAYQGMEATAVFHANGLRSPAGLLSVAITGNDNTQYRSKSLETRYNCSYEYFRDGMIFTKTGSYLYHLDGYTFEGYNFRRTYGFQVLPPPPTEPPTTTPTTTSPPLIACKNNGYQITQLDGSSTCFCQGLWTGNDCGQILCMNGGTVRTDNTCACPTGYSGNHCENVACVDNEGLEFDAEHPTLTLVLRVRSNMNDINRQVTQAVESLMGSLVFDPEYLVNFILVLFNNDKILWKQRYTSFDKMDTDLQTYAINSTSPDGDCYDSVFSAVSSALVEYPTYKSPVYIVTDAPPKDSELAETVFQQDSFYRAPLHFIYVQPDPLCIVSPEDPGFRKMDDISKRTGGQTFYLRNRTRVNDFISNHMQSTVYRSQLVLSNDVAICSLQNSYQAVTVDSTIQQITVVATGENLQLIVTMPHGENYSLAVTNYDDQGNYIWLVNGPHVGMWTFSVITTTPGSACTFRIFQKFYNNIEGQKQTSYDLFWSFSYGITWNGYTTQPVYGVDSGIVVKLTNYPYLPPQYVTAGLNIYANRNGIQTEVYASNGIWRDACDYNFYFPSYTCYVPNEILYFNFYARDQLGMAIQRAGNMYCSQIQPTQNPPSECQNGGVPNANGTSCFCPMGYTGDKCQQINCFNGGTAQGAKCLCTQFWTGDFCDIARCTERGVNPEAQLKYVDMVFAVEVTATGAGQIGWLNKYFGDLLRDIVSQNPKWIHRFVLTGFNSTWADVLAVATSNHYQDVVDALNTLTNTAFRDPNLDKGCNVQTWKAFDVAIMQRDVAPGSYMELFTTSTPDNSDTDGWNQLYEYSRAMNLHINTYLGTKSSNGGKGYYCNATDQDFYWLSALTSSSDGDLYFSDPAYTMNIIKTIPLQFMSQVALNQAYEDCTVGKTWYFPVDAYVQTIQLDVYGYGPTVTVYDMDGNEYDQLNLMKDDFTGLMINEVRKGCDDGWIAYDQFCFKFGTDHMTWPNAMKECHQAGGQLADDMTDDKHNFIMSIGQRYTFWIGMFNNGSNWYWDRPDGSQPVLMTNSETFWNGGSPPTDPTQQCVKYNGAGGRTDTWYGASCSEPQFFLCQKHNYDQNFRPENIIDDDLPNGKWSVKVKTSTSGCGLVLRVQSELQVFTGYSQTIGQDYPDNDPYRDSNQNRLIAYIHSQDNEYRNPFLSMAWITDAYNQTFYNAVRYQERISCAYPWVTQTFVCPNNQEDGNEFQVAHSGEDSFGNMFQRITFGHCQRTPLTCGDGGYRWQGQCICNEYWQGRYCTIPVCVNNGTLNSNNTMCLCPAGFTGPNCQTEMCESLNSGNFMFSDKTLIIILENTKQNLGAITALANNLTSIVAAVNPTFFSEFIVGTFDSTMNVNFVMYDTAAEAAAAIKALNPTDQGLCSMPIYSAINAFLTSDLNDYIAWPNSEMLLFTAAGAGGDTRRRDDLINLADQRIRMSLFYNSDSCGAQPADGSINDLVRTVYTTNGNVAFLKSNQIANYLISFLPSRFGAMTLTNPTVAQNFTCANSDWLVQIDANTEMIYVAVTAAIGDLGGYDPKTNLIIPQTLFSQDGTRLYQINTRGNPGIYTFNIISYGGCYASIWSTGGASVTALYALTTTTNPTGSRQDGRWHSPSAFVQNVLAAHLEGVSSHRGRLQYVEIFDVDTSQMVLRSELYRRDGPFGTYPGTTCQYEYVSDPFSCDSDLLAVYIYGMDETNIQFRRQLTAYCLNSTQTTVMPTTSTSKPLTTTTPTTMTTTPMVPKTTQTTLPPTTSYGNLNLLFDVVFLLDVTQAAQPNYNTISKFIQTLMLSYTVGQANVRIGIIPVISKPFTIALSTLNSIQNQQSLIGFLNDIGAKDNDFSNTGQFVQPAIDLAVNPGFINEGYRTTVSNHVIIYITSTTAFNDLPTSAAIRSSKQYGFITIGYGTQAQDSGKLQDLAGGADCSYIANDVAALNTVALQKIKDLIWAADGNGKYCGM